MCDHEPKTRVSRVAEPEWMSTTFSWTEGSETGRVYLGCSWRGWKTERLQKCENGDFTTRVKVPPGTHKFQFAVDDKWCHSVNLPTSTDQYMAGTNSRDVSPPPDEQDARLVITEFVWLDKASDSVHLCGAWNSWRPAPMKSLGPNHWSITTRVPVGVQTFRFLVDGFPAHSKRLNIVNDDAQFNLIRVDAPPGLSSVSSECDDDNNKALVVKTAGDQTHCCPIS